jgi:hypothetical protein
MDPDQLPHNGLANSGPSSIWICISWGGVAPTGAGASARINNAKNITILKTDRLFFMADLL